MKEEKITEVFQQGFDCSQVVFSHFAEAYGMDKEMARKTASAFGGGFNRGETCGAVIGGLMALGLKYGHAKALDAPQKEQMAAKRDAFLEKLDAKYPSTRCRDLIGYDFSNPDDLQPMLDSGVLFSFCPKLIVDVLAILEEI